MEIREATDADIPKIVTLLKQSLGEELMPKSERYWRWKHIENPFGRSPVLLCWEGNDLIGVRAFMRWEWISRGQVYQGVRAVDTATHPDHQGKGIFKKLTLSLVSYCKDRGFDFVFNTPNGQSKPGYIKMGWEEAGRLPVKVNIRKPFNIAKNIVFKTGTFTNQKESSKIQYYLRHEGLDILMNRQVGHLNHLITNFSVPYLIWRYLDVPVVQYLAIGDVQGEELNGLIMGRIKKTRLGKEFRITDCFLNGADNRRALSKKLQECTKEWDIDYYTFSGTLGNHGEEILGKFPIVAPIGPMVTIRRLKLENLTWFKNFNSWSPSLGDLELF
jgi:GNAT superfamily N-acetyltransferase